MLLPNQTGLLLRQDERKKGVAQIKIEVSTKDGNKVCVSVDTEGLSTEHLNAVLNSELINVVKQIGSSSSLPVVNNLSTVSNDSVANDSVEEVSFDTVSSNTQPDPIQPENSEEFGEYESPNVLAGAVSRTDADLWYSISAWARLTNNLYPKQRGIAYSVGRIINRGGAVSIRQAYSARLILHRAAINGFTHSSLQNALDNVVGSYYDNFSAYEGRDRYEPDNSGDVSTNNADEFNSPQEPVLVTEVIDQDSDRSFKSNRSNNRRFTINHRLKKLDDEDRSKINLSRESIVEMIKNLVVNDFEYYCKFFKKEARVKKNVGTYLCTASEWAAVFQRFNLISSGLNSEEIDKLSKIILKILVHRRFKLVAECPGEDGEKATRKHIEAILKKCKNSDNRTVYIFSIREITPMI